VGAGRETVVEEVAATVVAAVKPLLRGRLHQLCLLLSVPAGLLLVLRASSTTARVGAVVYGLTLVGLFGISSAYHVHTWAPAARRRMKRLDHAMIYLFIAGTYTPFCLLVLGGVELVAVLAVVWLVAALGVGLQMGRRAASVGTSNALYLVLGWLMVAALPQIVTAVTVGQMALLAGGGLVYTAGALAFFNHWPNPVPHIFGYHEVWHVLVVVACACHYALLWQLVK